MASLADLDAVEFWIRLEPRPVLCYKLPCISAHFLRFARPGRRDGMLGSRTKLTALGVSLGIALASGCATPTGKPSLWGRMTGKKSPEEMMHIKTPEDLLKEMRETAKTAKKKTPAEQEQIVNRLAKEIQQEDDARMRARSCARCRRFHSRWPWRCSWPA